MGFGRLRSGRGRVADPVWETCKSLRDELAAGLVGFAAPHGNLRLEIPALPAGPALPAPHRRTYLQRRMRHQQSRKRGGTGGVLRRSVLPRGINRFEG